MEKYTKDFSVIIPVWRGAVQFLPKLLDSIPQKDGIEIIVADNSKIPLERGEIASDREITLLHSAPERHAGGSRNDGMAAASGKWLLFADADDYFTSDAFDVFYAHFNTDAEIVYTYMGGVYIDTGEPSDRGERYAKLVKGYCAGEIDETTLRTSFSSPCCKMVSHGLVDRHQLRFDEVRASNDIYFSLLSGYYAKKIEAVNRITYIATVNRGSLTQRRDFEVVRARLFARMKCNRFLREHGLHSQQGSVMVYFYEARRYGFRQQLALWRMVFKYRQNPFLGWRSWSKSLGIIRNKDKRESKYRE